MNSFKTLLSGLAVISLLAVAGSAFAYPSVAAKTKVNCAGCHTNASGGAALTEGGTAFKADNSKVPASAADGATYVGTKCKTCHLKQYKAWQETKHAKALAALQTAAPEKIAEMAKRLGVELKGPADKSDACLGCHVTGFGIESGYPAADSTKNAALAAVACEMCHGPGSKHVAAAKADKKAATNGAVSENMCRSCHTKEMSPEFDFAKYKAKGVHTVPTE